MFANTDRQRKFNKAMRQTIQFDTRVAKSMCLFIKNKGRAENLLNIDEENEIF